MGYGFDIGDFADDFEFTLLMLPSLNQASSAIFSALLLLRKPDVL